MKLFTCKQEESELHDENPVDPTPSFRSQLKEEETAPFLLT